MLPVYDAVQFIKILERGGRTKPWLVLIKEKDNLTRYAVKMFTRDDNEKRNALPNEVLGNVLGREFSLYVADGALIRFDEDFISTIEDPEIEEILYNSDDRIKFGTKFLQPAYEFVPAAFSSQEMQNYISLDSVFAFDILIRNIDRTNRNPNFLIYNKQGYIIDHEFAFDIDQDSAKNIYKCDFNFKDHIFYKYLYNKWSSTKEQFFDEFCEYLRLMNANSLLPYFSQLNHHGFSNHMQNIIINYLAEMKINSYNFGNLLRKIIG